MAKTKSNEENPHAQHRLRLKKRFLNEGLYHFEDYQTLELLLFYAIPTKDTSPLAKDLIKYFGSLSGVLEAKKEDLLSVNGVGEHTAIMLTMIPDLFRAYQRDKTTDIGILKNPGKLVEYLTALFVGETEEIVYILCFDQKEKLLCCEEIARGTQKTVPIDPQIIVSTAIRVHADGVILAHNHPQYWAIPSNDDRATTKHIQSIISKVGLKLIDHYIISNDGHCSMKDKGLLN